MITPDEQARIDARREREKLELSQKTVKQSSEQIDLNKKELKQSSELVKAIKGLTESFRESQEKDPAASEERAGGIKETIKEHFGSKLAGVKQMATPAGMLDLLAAKTGGGLLSTILSSSAESIRGKQAQKEEKAKWAQGFLSGTDKGRKLIKERGIDAASQDAADLFEKKKKLDREIAQIESERAQLKATGVEGADITRERAVALENKKLESKLLTMEPPAKKEETEAPKKAPVGPRPIEDSERFTPFWNTENTPEMQEARAKGQPTRQEENTNRSVKSRNEKETLAMAKEQVVLLRKLVKAATKTEEQALEEGLSKDKEVQAESATAPEKKKTILDKILDPVKKTTLFDKVKDLASGAMNLLGKTGAAYLTRVPAAAAAGYGAGTLLNKAVLDPASQALTGEKGATVGTALYKGVDKVKGWFGMGSEDDTSRVDQENKLKLGRSMLERGQRVSRDMAQTLTAAGVSVPESSIAIPAAQPYRETQTQQLEQRTDEVKAAQESKKTEETAKIVSSNTVVDNSRSTTIVRPDVRTKEPTFNRVLSNNFA